MGKCCSCCKKKPNSEVDAHHHFTRDQIYAIYEANNNNNTNYSTIPDILDQRFPSLTTLTENELRILPNDANFFPQTVTPLRTGPQFAPGQAGHENLRKNERRNWSCSRCLFDNDPEMPHCEMCGMGNLLNEASADSFPQYTNVAETTPHLEVAATGIGNQGYIGSQNWSCAICHFENHSEMPHCEMCAIKTTASNDQTGPSATANEHDHIPQPQKTNMAVQEARKLMHL